MCPTGERVDRADTWVFEERRTTAAEEAALLMAIVNNPADLTARLVYCDWLDEHDDPRAIFLRIGCEAASMRPEDERWFALKLRAEEIWVGLVVNPRWREWAEFVAPPGLPAHPGQW
jgi:uncharacterized protein (TIGR02996 family)